MSNQQAWGYTGIAEYFRAKIQTGKLLPGASLPTQRETAAKLNVAITTVNRAYQLLKAEGYTTASTGSGTIVARARPVITGADRLDRIAKGGPNYGHEETSSDHTAVITPCTEEWVAKNFGIALGDDVLVRRRVFRTDGKPVSLATSYFLPSVMEVVPEALHQGRMEKSVHILYDERIDGSVLRSEEAVSSRLATAEELRALEVEIEPKAVPVTVLRVMLHSENGILSVWEDVLTPGSWKTIPTGN
ncbi:GntR family transcriptional regulator [Streptomyces sp. NPDC000927]|uniref:GntR family transcriptional regulator n=1 Tax=Streptomyces sp. NPDC000927 TaxID=3154371 RepID=UPI0033334EEC